MLLAQITDLHVSVPGTPLDAEYRTAHHLANAVAHLNRLEPRPDAVFCTGDLVEGGTPDEYARLLEILRGLTAPYYVLPGNHDDRENLRAAFLDHGYLPREGFLCYVVELGPLRVIALDTHVPGEPRGRLCAERLKWLDERLSEAPEQPTVVVQHHPPFMTGLRHMDGMGLDGTDGLEEVLRRHPQVERILCGHIHRPIVRRFAGTIASTCPSTSHQLELDLREPGRLAVLAEPRACQLHYWSDELGLVSHLSFIGDYGPPFVVKGM